MYYCYVLTVGKYLLRRAAAAWVSDFRISLEYEKYRIIHEIVQSVRFDCCATTMADATTMRSWRIRQLHIIIIIITRTLL